MKILMLTSRMDIGGAESHIYTLSRELAALGHRVAVMSAGGRYVPLLGEAGIEHITLPLDQKTPQALSLCRREILGYIKKHSPEVLHSHSRIPSFILDGILTSHPHLCPPFVMTAHMPFRSSPFLKSASAWGERCIAVSDDIAAYLFDTYNVQKKRLTVIENGIDIPHHEAAKRERERTRASLSIGAEERVICSASRTSESRAAVLLYLAGNAPRLIADGGVLLLCISGAVGLERDMAGIIRARAERANKALGRRAVIIIEGEADISRYIACSDIFIGVSRAAMEGMACALPVIIAGNEGTGGIFSPESASRLAKANLTGRGSGVDFPSVEADLAALSDPEVRDRLGAFSLSYAQMHFSAARMAQRTLSVYREACRGRVLFIGNYGAQNMGDDASERILCRALGGKLSLSFVCRDPEDCTARGIRRTSLGEILREAVRSDAVVLGTGNLLQDRTSMRSMIYYSVLFSLCSHLTDTCAVFAGGVGPLGRPLSRMLASWVLGRADYVSVRERRSLAAVRSLSKREDTRLGADIVLLTEKKKTPAPADGRYCLIFPRGGMAESDTAAISRLMRCCERKGITPVLAAMDRKRDLGICRTLSGGRVRILDVTDAAELLSMIGGGCFCICARLHAAVLCALADTAYIGSDTDGRIAAFSEYSGTGEVLRSGGYTHAELTSALARELRRHKARPYKESADRLARRAIGDIEELYLRIMTK